MGLGISAPCNRHLHLQSPTNRETVVVRQAGALGVRLAENEQGVYVDAVDWRGGTLDGQGTMER